MIRKSFKNLGRGSACTLSLQSVHEGLSFKKALYSRASSCCMRSLGGICIAMPGPFTPLLYATQAPVSAAMQYFFQEKPYHVKSAQ